MLGDQIGTLAYMIDAMNRDVNMTDFLPRVSYKIPKIGVRINCGKNCNS